MVKRLVPHMLLAVIAVVVVFTTAYRKVEVSNKEDLSTISCGCPLAFMVSDQSWRDPPFPWMASCMGGEWDDPRTILWPQFAANVAAFYILGAALMFGYRAIRKKSMVA